MRYWEHISPACMTEESDSEQGERIVTHQLMWRSECELWRRPVFFLIVPPFLSLLYVCCDLEFVLILAAMCCDGCWIMVAVFQFNHLA